MRSDRDGRLTLLQTGQGSVTTESPGGSAHPAKEHAAAHQGFLARAQSVPVELLYIRARQQGKRLILCGTPMALPRHACNPGGSHLVIVHRETYRNVDHVATPSQWGCMYAVVRSTSGQCAAGHSLGGAVAKLCTLRLLYQLDSREAAQGHVKCVAFAAPALGNAALAALVAQQGWSHAFYNLTLPGGGCHVPVLC